MHCSVAGREDQAFLKVRTEHVEKQVFLAGPSSRCCQQVNGKTECLYTVQRQLREAIERIDSRGLPHYSASVP